MAEKLPSAELKDLTEEIESTLVYFVNLVGIFALATTIMLIGTVATDLFVALATLPAGALTESVPSALLVNVNEGKLPARNAPLVATGSVTCSEPPPRESAAR